MTRAFTLLELLVSSAILAFIVGGVIAVAIIADRAWNKDMTLTQLTQEARQAIDGMTKELRETQANYISIPQTLDSIQFNIPTSLNPVTFSTNPIKYYLNVNHQIVRESPPGANPMVLANNIESLNFCCGNGVCNEDCNGATVVQIQVSATKTVRQQELRFPLNGQLIEKVRLRN